MKLTPKEREEILKRLKYGPKLTRIELVKYLMKIAREKRESEQAEDPDLQ